MGALTGHTALVTGGSRGIGRAIVERLAADGAQVVFSYRSSEVAAQEVVAGVEQTGGSARSMQADLARLAEVRHLFAAADAALGGLDIVVNNAAVVGGMAVVDATEEDYDRIMGTNAKGTFFALREAARRVRDGGRIINLSTVNTVLPAPGVALYAASKAAIELFTAVAAKELGGRRITVNVVSPGATDTEMLREANAPEVLAALAGMSPLGRLGEPWEVAAVVAFLAGPDGGWLTGQNIRAGGGIT
jgi:3-oxoacyl-[acyl-carrier protein] reductase